MKCVRQWLPDGCHTRAKHPETVGGNHATRRRVKDSLEKKEKKNSSQTFSVSMINLG